MGIQVLDDAGEMIQLPPDPNIRPLHWLETFHLIAEPPGQQRGMILVFQDGIAEPGALRGDACRVGVIESMADMLHPESGRDGNAQFMSSIEQRFAINKLL